MPVILELQEFEADLVVAALMEGRIRLMKDWGDRYRSQDRSPFEDDLAEIDADIVAVADIRERLKEGIMWQRYCQGRSLEPEKKVSVAWHHRHGWMPTADFVEKPIEDVFDQEQISPGTWTTIPDSYAIAFAEPTTVPYWNDMETQSDGLLERPDGYRLQICRIRRTREGFYKLGFTDPFRDMFRSFRKLYPDLDAAKTAAEEIFRGGLERHGLAFAS
ncbi:hypothetical protein [Sinorhizobium meliloti]|uniref:hypothetical protein n=1 Tax=Rhizobium meliloti TaxID=382 RepID=UPI000FE0B01B|nr:hypothetical protein [Sinorhizobium meliloti]RVG70889.1 hypothetical protein CN222_01765 [Sinorhizobium meliloti]